MDKLPGFLTPALVFLLVFVLNVALPGRRVIGYATSAKTKHKIRYRLNGILVLFVVLFTWVILCSNSILPWDWFYRSRWYGLAGATLFGLLFSLAAVLPHPKVKDSFLADFFHGRSENPQLWGGRTDTKLWLYLAGAILLELNILGIVTHNRLVANDQPSYGLYMSAALLTLFVVDYLIFEEAHLYTYDFIAERVGFKLGWGCTAFYPYFYALPLWIAAEMPSPATPIWLQGAFVVLFLAGWGLSRGANMQKFFFRKNPKAAFLGILPQSISNGNNSLLTNGFWGMSRHINYLGELVMAVGIVLSTGPVLLTWAWLYPLYYLILLVARQSADDKRCTLKYGTLWQEYKKKVPYRIIPYIY